MNRIALLLASLALVATTASAQSVASVTVAASPAAEFTSTTDRVSTRKLYRPVARPTEAPLMQAAPREQRTIVGKMLSPRISRRGVKGL